MPAGNASTSVLLPPYIGLLGEVGCPDDFRGHPGVSACAAHVGGVLYFTGEAKVSDFYYVVSHVNGIRRVREEN